MDKIHRRALVQCRSKIVTDLSPDNEFWDKVAEQEIFTPLMLEYIQSTNPRPDKVRKLLDDLSRRGPDAYDKFLDCLDQSGHSHISDYIREKERQLRNPNSNPVLQGSRFSVQQRTSGSHGNQVICQPTHPPESSCELTHSASDVPLSSYLQSSSVVTSQSSPSLSLSGLPLSTPSEENSSQSENPDVQMRTPVENQNQNSTALGYLHETLADNTSSQFVQVPDFNLNQALTSERSKKYKMESNPRGCVLMINNVNFDNGRHRPGAERDTHQLQNLFLTLGFEVEVRENKTANEIKEDLLAFSKLESLHNVDSLIVVLMSHGSDQFIVGTDNQKINVLDLVKLFNGDHCPAMINKPKLFLINACRGGDFDCIVRLGGTVPGIDSGENDIERSLFRNHPANSDLLLAYSTFPGYVSFRDEDDGSWFVQCFVEVFNNHAREEHVMDLLTMVNREVARMGECEEGYNHMIPAPMTTLRYKWFLNPPAS